MRTSIWVRLCRIWSRYRPGGGPFSALGVRGYLGAFVALVLVLTASGMSGSRGTTEARSASPRPAPSADDGVEQAAAPPETPAPEPTPTPVPLGAFHDRRLPTVDHLPPPPDEAFHGTVTPVPPEVVARSTWAPGCPVPLEDLRYLTLSFWGFDGRPHTGELIVHASVADGILGVFRRLHELRFPIEEMRVVTPSDLEGPGTGDGNNSSAFACRSAAGSTNWSEHAKGLAVDVNPFHNPYVRGAEIIPALATAYVDRGLYRPGMVTPEVIAAFADIGWGWGGHWTSVTDPMHFSATGH